MEVKTWFENGTGLKIKELRYIKPPKLPYFLYENEQEYRGADLLNNIIENNIIIERYSETNCENDLIEISKVNDFLEKNFFTFKIQNDHLEKENLYATYWVLDPVLEKVRKK